MSQDIEPIVFEQDGKAWTDSRHVADMFAKEHRNVLRTIDGLIAEAQEDGISLLNFEQRTYLNERGQSQRCYEMSRDGFTELAMGFTGSAARKWRRKYISAFNSMEKRLSERAAIEQDKRTRAIEAQMEKLQRTIDAITADQERDDNYYTLDEIVRILKIKDVPARAPPAASEIGACVQHPTRAGAWVGEQRARDGARMRSYLTGTNRSVPAGAEFWRTVAGPQLLRRSSVKTIW